MVFHRFLLVEVAPGRASRRASLDVERGEEELSARSASEGALQSEMEAQCLSSSVEWESFLERTEKNSRAARSADAAAKAKGIHPTRSPPGLVDPLCGAHEKNLGGPLNPRLSFRRRVF
jgi:hypothetical protein